MKTLKKIVIGTMFAAVLLPAVPMHAATSCGTPPCAEEKIGSGDIYQRIYMITGVQLVKTDNPARENLIKKLYTLLLQKARVGLEERRSK